MSIQWIFGGTTSQLSTTNTEYVCLLGGDVLQTTEARCRMPWAADGDFTEFYVWLTTAPGTGKSRDLQIMAGTGASSSEVLGVSVSGTDTDGNDVVASIGISAGDEVFIKSTPNSTPAASYLRWAAKWEPDTEGEHVVGGMTANTQLSTTGSQYLSPCGEMSAPYSSEQFPRMYLPVAGDAYDFYFHLLTAPGVGNKTRVFNIRKNGANDTSTNVSISNLVTTGNNTGNSVSCDVGDYIDHVSRLTDFADPAPNASYLGYSYIFKADDTDIFLFGNNGASYLPTGTATNYRQAQTGGNVFSSSLTGRRFNAKEMWIESAYFQISNIPSSGSWGARLYNITGGPGASWFSTSTAAVFAPAPKFVPDERVFSMRADSDSISASPPDNATTLTACYACKDGSLRPARFVPTML